MSDNQRINDFLNYWAEIYQNNPEKNYEKGHFYHALTHDEVKPEDTVVSLSLDISRQYPNYSKAPGEVSPLSHPNSTFNNWIQYYSDSPKTSCFIADNWQYFCQFISKDNNARLQTEHIKIYIPLDAEHIEYGATLIFDFLERNNISHLSKIGKKIRSDDIVIRLVNPNDAEKLINFVNDTPYLQEGLIKPIPFTFQKDGIGMAVDGMLSYNDTISILLKAYMDHTKETKTLNKVDADDFYAYVRELYISQFVSHKSEKLHEIIGWNEEEERDYHLVVGLIIKVHDPSFTFEDYLEHYRLCSGVSILTEQNIIDTNRLLIEALQAMTLRWNEDGTRYVRAYIATANEDFITKNNNLRNRIVNSNFRETIKAILHQRNMTFDQYAETILNQYHIDLNELLQQKKGL